MEPSTKMMIKFLVKRIRERRENITTGTQALIIYSDILGLRKLWKQRHEKLSENQKG